MAIHIRRRELLPADQIRKRERLAAVGDVDHVDTGHHLSGSTAFMFRPGWKTMRSACWSLSALHRRARRDLVGLTDGVRESARSWTD